MPNNISLLAYTLGTIYLIVLIYANFWNFFGTIKYTGIGNADNCTDE